MDFVEKLEVLYDSINCNKKFKDLKDFDSSLSSELVENVLKYKYRPLLQHPVNFNESKLTEIVNEIIEG